MKPAYAPAHDSLASLLPILDAFAHRHRNQHGVSHWWASFNILRRGVRNLDTAFLSTSPGWAGSDADNDRVRGRARWLAQHVVPRSYVAFTQLAADNQYAPLGLLLLAVIARINTVLSDPLLQEPVFTSSPASEFTSVKPDHPLSANSPDLDTGVAMSRDDIIPSSTRIKDAAVPMPEPKTPASGEDIKKKTKTKEHNPSKDTRKERKKKKKKKKKKKRKGGDELSNIFGALT